MSAAWKIGLDAEHELIELRVVANLAAAEPTIEIDRPDDPPVGPLTPTALSPQP